MVEGESVMARIAKAVTCDEATLKELRIKAQSKTLEARIVQRARIVLYCIEGRKISEVAALVGESVPTVIMWRDRFVAQGINGLSDRPRTGKPATYGDAFKNKVLGLLSTEPPNGLSRWDGPEVAKALDASVDAVWRVLRKEGVQLARQRSWCVSTDPEFTAKAADIVGLYLAPPDDAIVISIDEKPSMQALSRTVGYVKTRNGKTIRAIKSTYRRNGTQNLFAALEVATGQIHAKTTKYKKKVDFLAFMDDLLKELPQGGEAHYHVILDNYCIHKNNDAWLEAHPNVHFHYTPTSASWLNQVEIWFNIMSRKVLRGASFDNTEQLCEAISKYVLAYNQSAEPFIWKKREVKGSQIKDNLTNLCN